MHLYIKVCVINVSTGEKNSNVTIKHNSSEKATQTSSCFAQTISEIQIDLKDLQHILQKSP